MSKLSRRLIVSLFALLLLMFAVIIVVDRWVTDSTKNQLYTDINIIPKNKVGLLLGTSKFIKKGVLNPYYQNRIRAAAMLYKAGKVDFLIVSGDNRSVNYNEPETMRRDLIAQGVPPAKIFLDYGGIHTLDSILRCRDIFGEDHITIISQAFHNERALFIANHKHIAAIAYNADDVNNNSRYKEMLREKLARIKMIIDLLLNHQPKYFYGDKVNIN